MHTNKGTPLVALILAGVLLVLLVFANLAVWMRGRISLHQTVGEVQPEAAEQENDEETQQSVSGEIAGFHIGRASQVIGEAVKPQTEASMDYLCAESIVRVLNEQDVANLQAGVYEGLPEGKDIIQMIVNEIYARNGYQFENPEIQAYFSAKSWYQPGTEAVGDMDAVYNKMPDIDRANIDFLKGIG